MAFDLKPWDYSKLFLPHYCVRRDLSLCSLSESPVLITKLPRGVRSNGIKKVSVAGLQPQAQ